jgi:hypothetical protein
MNANQLFKLRELAALTRQELSQFVQRNEDFDDDWCGSCLLCSWVLNKVLRAHGFNSELCVGTYDKICHAFVMLDEYVVDITATQFENPEVFIEVFEGSDYKVKAKSEKIYKTIRNWPAEQIPKTYRRELSRIFRRIIGGK